ncbi:MAG: hypothetical protein JXR73_17105 [Candidatus Omnitrophica bacterium]|nr:hypothetical protein [Candidatus Omnitrophota bacterium]
MNHANPLPIVLIAGFFFSFAPGAMGQCTDVPTTPEIGVYSTYRLDYDYRYAPNISSSNKVTYEFTILQWWGCCTLSENCNIVITTAYGTQPVKVWQDPENGVDADFEFSAKGKYIVSASHHGFSNCAGGTNVRSLNFFLTDDLNDLDADGILNWEDANADGDLLNNDVDPDDDNDDVLDDIDSTPGGEGTTQSAWPSDWGGSGPASGGTPTIPIPTPTSTPTPTATPTVSPIKIHAVFSCKHPSSVFTQSKLDALEKTGYQVISRDDFWSQSPTPMPDNPTYGKIDCYALFTCPDLSQGDEYVDVDKEEFTYLFSWMRDHNVNLLCVPKIYGKTSNIAGIAEDFNVKRFLLADNADNAALTVLYHEWGHCLGLHHPDDLCLKYSIADEKWSTFIMHKFARPNIQCRMGLEDKNAYE